MKRMCCRKIANNEVHYSAITAHPELFYSSYIAANTNNSLFIKEWHITIHIC